MRLGGGAPPADRDDLPDDVAHLMGQKTRRPQAERQPVQGGVEGGFLQGAHCAGAISAPGEGGEIVLALQAREGSLHGLEVQRTAKDPGAPLPERLALGSEAQAVVVGAVLGVASGVKTRRDLACGLNGHVRREEVVEAPDPAGEGDGGGGGEGGDLAKGVDAGVGAAGKVTAGAGAGQGGDGIFQRGLYRGGVRLALGTGESGAMILEQEGDAPGRAGHGGLRLVGGGVVGGGGVRCGLEIGHIAGCGRNARGGIR